MYKRQKYEIPVRIVLPAERQNSIDQLLKLKLRGREGQMVPVSEVVEIKRTLREKVIYHKDLLPVVFVTGDMGGRLDSPLYGMFDILSLIHIFIEVAVYCAPNKAWPGITPMMVSGIGAMMMSGMRYERNCATTSR